MTPFIKKQVKNPQKKTLKSFEDFTILLKEINKFKLHLKESILIKRDKPELNSNIYSYTLEPFDWLFS